MAEILGRTLGHVPAGLCSVMSSGIKEGVVIGVHAVYTGDIIHGGPFRGGGPKLTAVYVLDLSEEANVHDLTDQISVHVDDEDIYLFH